MFSIIQPLLYKTCRSLEGSSCNSLETTYILFKLPQVYVSQRRTHSQVFSIFRFYHKLQTYNKIWILKVRPKVNNLISIKCTHILVFFQFYIRLSNKPWRQISYLVQICKYLLGALLLFSNSSLTILNYYKGHIISNVISFQRLNVSYNSLFLYHYFLAISIVLRGLSINYVVSKSAFFDPLPLVIFFISLYSK